MCKKNKSTSYISTLVGTLAGIAIGVGGKYLYDKVEEESKLKASIVDEKPDKEKDEDLENKTDTDNNLLEEFESFQCPISLEIMNDPVISPHGITFERKNIEFKKK